MDRLKLIAEYSLTYAPHHVAEHLGLFRDMELAVETDYASGPGGSWLGDVLGRGEADMARGGVWIPMMYRHRLERFRIFAQLCARNCQVLLSRRPEPDFRFSDLTGRTVLLPMAATSQWMFLQGLLREQGVDPDGIRWIRDLEVSTMVRLWRAGLGDHLLLGPPLADAMMAEGHFVATDLGITGGAVPWSVYYAPEGSDRARPLSRFTAALARASAWMETAPAEEIAELIAPDFPQLDLRIMTAALGRMRANGTWPKDMAVPSIAFDRYQAIIAAHGLIRAPLPHPDILWPGLAERASATTDIHFQNEAPAK